MKVLIVVERLKEVQHHIEFNLVQSFQSAFENDPNYELIVRYISPLDIRSAPDLSNVLLNTDYDIAVVSPLWNVHVELSVAKKVGKKLFIYLTDTHTPTFTSNRYINFRTFLKSKPECGHTFVHSCLEYAQYCNIVILDYGHGEAFPNIYCMHPAFDSRVLYSIPEDERTYDLTFMGSINTNERQFFIKNIQKNFDLKVFGNKYKLSWSKFSEVYRKSKMIFAFNEIHNGMPHRKWKIYEAASCGNFVFATHPEVYVDKGYEIFTDGVHYSSINKSNYKEVIKYYLENPEKRIEMSNQLHSHYMENYSEKPFWYNIFKYAKDK